jgi:hypothetical protein
VEAFGMLIKFKMADVAMVTKVQKLLNLFQTSRNFTAKFVLPIPIFLAYLVPLDVYVTGNITAKICEVWSEFNIFCTLVTMTMAAILKKNSTPKSCHTLWWIFLQSFMKFDESNPKKN